jgi:hypothetical protein
MGIELAPFFQAVNGPRRDKFFVRRKKEIRKKTAGVVLRVAIHPPDSLLIKFRSEI